MRGRSFKPPAHSGIRSPVMQRWPPITSLIDSSTRFRIALFATRRQHQHQQQPFPHRTARLETPLPAMHMQGHRTGPLSRITIPSNKDRDHDGNNVTHLHSSLSRHTFRSPSHSLHRPRFHSQLPRCTPTQQVQCQPRSFASQQTFGVDSTSINHDYNSSSYKYSSYYTPPQQDSGAAEKKQQEEAPLLKKKLKRFYLRVHPDLFEPFPREQAVNAENLAMLSNFFDEINGDRELGTTHLDLSFYIKVENTADADQTGKQGKTKAKERKEEGKERTRGVHYGNANEADARTVKASRLVQEAEFVEFSHSDGGKAGDHAHTKTNPDTNPWDNPPNPWEDDGDEEGDDDDGGVWRGGGRGGGKHIPHRKRATTSQRYSYHQQQQQHHHQQQQQQQQRITKTVGGDDDSTGPADRKKLEPQQKFELIRVSCSFKEPSQKERVRMMKQGSANIASYKLKIRHSMGQLLETLFERTGLGRDFQWGDMFFGKHSHPSGQHNPWQTAHTATIYDYMSDISDITQDSATSESSEIQAQGASFLLCKLRMKNVNILFEEVGSRSSAGILRDFMTVIRDSPHQDPLASSDHRDSDRFIQVLDDLKRKKDEGPRMGSRANPIGMMGGVGFGQGGASGQVNEISEEIAQLIHGYSPGSTAEPPFPSSSPSSSSSGFDHINLQQSPFCGMISVFSGKATVSHVDERGRLVFALDQPHPKEEWGGFLQQETIFEIAAERKRRALQTRERENRASELTGVYDFFCEPLLCNNPSYLAFLDRMEQQAPAFSDLFDQYPTLRELPVHVYKLPRSNAQYEGPLSLDREMGYIAVRLDSTPEMLMAFMMEKGMAAFELLRLHKEETEKYNRILLNAKRRLQVQVLERKAERVSREQMRDACLKLGRASIKLQGLFKGLRVHVSDHYDFDESGLVVIPHDFRMGTFY